MKPNDANARRYNTAESLLLPNVIPPVAATKNRIKTQNNPI